VPWDFIVILIFLAVVIPLMGRHRIRRLFALPRTTKMDRLTVYASTIAFQCFTAVVVLWRAMTHHITPRDLGLALTNVRLTLGVTGVLTVLIVANQFASIRRLTTRREEMQDVLRELALKVFPQDDVERLAYFGLVSVVALCEELIYRGFLQYVFQSVAHGAVIAGVLGSAGMFALAHLYQGRRGLVSTLFAGTILAGVRAWTGSLVPCIVPHFAADLAAGFLAPRRFREGGVIPDGT